MDNTKKSIELEEWQVKALRNYFGENDKTQTSHWAFIVFDEAIKNKTNDQTTQLREDNERFKDTIKKLINELKQSSSLNGGLIKEAEQLLKEQ